MDTYATLKREASKLKLKGLRLLSEGGFENAFEGSVALHAAARAERAAATRLTISSQDTLLSSAIEECGCYIDARSPRWAEMAWRRIAKILSQGELPSSLSNAALNFETPAGQQPEIGKLGFAHYMAPEGNPVVLSDPRLDRIRDRFFKQQKEFRKAILACPTLVERASIGTIVPDEPHKRSRLKKELDGLAMRFFGDPHIWFALYRLEESNDRQVPALEAIWRALKLEPDDPSFKTLHFHTLSKVPEYRDAFENLLNSIFTNRDKESFEILIFHSLAMMRIADVDPQQAENVLRIAQDDLRLAAQKKPIRSDADQLRKAQFLLDTKLAGKEPSREELEAQGILPTSAPASALTDLTFIMQEELTEHLSPDSNLELRTTAFRS